MHSESIYFSTTASSIWTFFRRYLAEETWRSIEGAPRLMRDCIRSRAEPALYAKYDRFQWSTRSESRDGESSSPLVHNPNFSGVSSTSQISRVTHFTGRLSPSVSFYCLESEIAAILTPAQNTNTLTFRDVVGGLHRLRDPMRNESRSGLPRLTERKFASCTLSSQKLQGTGPVPEADVKLRILPSRQLAIPSHHIPQIELGQCSMAVAKRYWKGNHCSTVDILMTAPS